MERFYESFPGLKLSTSDRSFSLLSGVKMSVRHNGKSHQLVLTVVKACTSVLPLMGQDWLDVLYPGWREFFKKYNAKNRI